jgi:phosphate transport system ATP-binding protein
VGVKIEVAGLSAWHGSHKAIEDIDLVMEANQVTAIIGPSGCGKSTLIRCLNRLHEVAPRARVQGKVALDGVDIYDPAVDPVSVRRSIGMVFQRPNPFPTMSIFDNVVAGHRLNGRTPKPDLDEIVERSLAATSLFEEVKDRLHAPAASLSEGQQQRLCIARAIAVQPAALLMDEPCSALDPAATLRIEDLIDELRERYTIVLVTHNMQQAARVADVTAFMLADRMDGRKRRRSAGSSIEGTMGTGRIVEVASTHRVFTWPEDRRTEAYVTGRFGS